MANGRVDPDRLARIQFDSERIADLRYLQVMLEKIHVMRITVQAKFQIKDTGQVDYTMETVDLKGYLAFCRKMVDVILKNDNLIITTRIIKVER